jgi:serine/threonine-protein kinase RsbW
MPTLTLPASLESLSALRSFLNEASTDCGREEQAVYDLKLAVDEIATNAIIHGGASTRPPGTFTLRAETSPEAFTVILEDYGGPFDPRLAPRHAPPGGWGVQLALNGVDRFDYQRDGERNRYTFVLSRRAPSAGDGG